MTPERANELRASHARDPENPPAFFGMTCRGDQALGSACGWCERCIFYGWDKRPVDLIKPQGLKITEAEAVMDDTLEVRVMMGYRADALKTASSHLHAAVAHQPGSKKTQAYRAVADDLWRQAEVLKTQAANLSPLSNFALHAPHPDSHLRGDGS